jgi:putative ABC transport system permease protein
VTAGAAFRRPAVPLARRLLFADRRRGVLTVAGVAAALLLVLTLDAIFAGAVARVTYYIRTSPADVFVSQSGVRTMHMSSSALPADTVGEAAAVPGAAWSAPVAFISGAVLDTAAGGQLSYLVGYDPTTGRGGPPNLVAGRAPGVGEAVVDRLAADRLGLRLGASATVLGTSLRVVGFSDGATSITNTTVFVSLAQFADLRGPTVSYVLVHAAAGTGSDVLARRLSAALPGLTVQTRAEFADSEARVVTDMSADLIRLMALIGLLIALAVVALGLLTTTLSRLRDYAVLKALGASTPRLARIVAGQAGWIIALALAAASGAALLLAAALPVAAPSVQMTVTAGSVTRLGVAALGAGVVAAMLPLRRLATLDAATAFQETR